MRLLLDTHFAYWVFYETARLSQQAKEFIYGAEEIFVSSASIWEMAIKVRLGKMGGDPREMANMIEEADFEELPVLSRHAVLIADMPMHHADPFDRLLIAQAQAEGLRLLTANAKLKPYGDLVVCV
jgi:PIN domain nuclease of toxin-antitoxin system